MKFRIAAFSATLVAVLAANVQAQIPWYLPPAAGWANGGHLFTGYGYGGYGYGYGYPSYSSTVAEGQARGLADVIRARGAASQDIAQARVANEKARAEYIENQQKLQDAFLDRKRAYEAEKSQEQAEARVSRERYEASMRSLPKPGLSSSQLNPVTGEISWPAALTEPKFAETRKKLDELFATRAQSHSTSNAEQIESLVRDMTADLKLQIRDMPPEVYISGKKFLENLTYEAWQTS